MNLNRNPNKQARIRNYIQSEKNASLHPIVYFNNKPVNSTKIHRHLGMALDSRLRYEDHVKFVLSKVNKTIGFLRKFQPVQEVL